MSYESIIVVDFGGQGSQPVARQIRDCGVYSEVTPYAKAMELIRDLEPSGIVFSGGAGSVTEESPAIDKAVYELGIPILGIGYGARLLVRDFGGTLQPPEDSDAWQAGLVAVNAVGGLMNEVTGKGIAWMEPCDQIAELPEGFEVTAVSDICPSVAVEDAARKLYAVQFYPEAEKTTFGRELFGEFLYGVCKCKGDWDAANYTETTIREIGEVVGDGKVLCALSGGVDSTVVALMTHKAIGEQLTCVFVDHGLLRKNEADEVMAALSEEFELNVICVDAKERFLAKLAGVTDPEQKRKIIGYEFIEVFAEEAKKLGEMDFLLQGTIYPDIIESGVGAALVKSHHNVGGLPEKLGFELLEPMRYLFKDEVRRVGLELGISEKFVYRQPFPGPGLGVRCLGEVTESKLAIVRESDAILREEIAKAGLAREIWQYFTVLPGIRSVGVVNGERTYCEAVGIRAVTSVDAMTGDWARIPHAVLEAISTRIVNEVPGVNRVLYDVTAKPPSTIEWE